jgi:hypothetical protein
MDGTPSLDSVVASRDAAISTTTKAADFSTSSTAGKSADTSLTTLVSANSAANHSGRNSSGLVAPQGPSLRSSSIYALRTPLSKPRRRPSPTLPAEIPLSLPTSPRAAWPWASTATLALPRRPYPTTSAWPSYLLLPLPLSSLDPSSAIPLASARVPPTSQPTLNRPSPIP